MANGYSKPLWSAPAALTLTAASLATSAAGVGRQSTLVSNTGSYIYDLIRVICRVTVGTTPTANTTIGIYPLFGDGTRRTDGAGASDAGITIINAPLWLPIKNPATTSNTQYSGILYIPDPGDEWGIALVHNTGVNLNSTAGNHDFYWQGRYWEQVAAA